ncbi:MAG: FecR domain-containing protein [Kofleriaceae bacterium]
MSGHVPPHQWADAMHGRVEEAERVEMERHAASCKRCARSKARIQRASDTFSVIRTQSAPELPWDSVRAKVHWSVSTERRAKVAPIVARSRRGWVAVAAAAAVATFGVFAVDRHEPNPPIAVAPAPRVSPMPSLAPAALAGLVTRATGDVLIDGLRPDNLFAKKLVAGSVLATGDGRVDIQFGTASGFGLGRRSMLELRKFDATTIELVVEGTVDIEVGSRMAGQRFIVIAGDRTIEVRGTQFRVRHDAESTTVACRHGLVAVRDSHGQLEVGAARTLEVKSGRRVSEYEVTALSPVEVTALADATPVTLPIWNFETLVQTSAPLEISTVGRREVRVDGVELGRAPMHIRVMPGRHTVEAADSAGRFRRAGWIDVAAPSRVPSRHGSRYPPRRLRRAIPRRAAASFARASIARGSARVRGSSRNPRISPAPMCRSSSRSTRAVRSGSSTSSRRIFRRTPPNASGAYSQMSRSVRALRRPGTSGSISKRSITAGDASPHLGPPRRV